MIVIHDITYNSLFLVGSEHCISFLCCQCEPVAVTMIRARLWPAYPSNPHLAFTFDLLDWAEALLLECQVALRTFVTPSTSNAHF